MSECKREMEAKGKIINAKRLKGPMVPIGTFRLVTDVALQEDGTNLIVYGVDIPIRAFLTAIMRMGLMTEDEVNVWLDKKIKELRWADGPEHKEEKNDIEED